MDGLIYRFRDPTALVKWTRLSIYAHMALLCAALYSGCIEYGVLVGIRDGALTPRQNTTSATEAIRTTLVGVAQIAIYIASRVLVLRWIHRANWNARALGARHLEFTPGWAIGWYFVPVMNLWKPYEAMKEIWQASAKPADWRRQSVPPLVSLWWFFWIVHVLVGNASLRMTWRAASVDELINAGVVTILSDLVDFPLCIVFLALLARIDAMQSLAAEAPQGESPRTQDTSDESPSATSDHRPTVELLEWPEKFLDPTPAVELDGGFRAFLEEMRAAGAAVFADQGWALFEFRRDERSIHFIRRGRSGFVDGRYRPNRETYWEVRPVTDGALEPLGPMFGIREPACVVVCGLPAIRSITMRWLEGASLADSVSGVTLWDRMDVSEPLRPIG